MEESVSVLCCSDGWLAPEDGGREAGSLPKDGRGVGHGQAAWLHREGDDVVRKVVGKGLRRRGAACGSTRRHTWLAVAGGGGAAVGTRICKFGPFEYYELVP